MGHDQVPRAAALLGAALLFAACGDSPVAIPEAFVPMEPGRIADVAAASGAQAFATECATCHASGDGFDLAFFRFSDTTIIRRAVHHVDTATAVLIVHHIRSLGLSDATRDTRAFQVPHAASDHDFAVRLFGSDGWPAGLTENDLLALDPTKVAAAVDFPLWSDEQSNLDWMPDEPLPPEVFGPPDGRVQQVLGAYYARPSDMSLTRAVAVLRQAANAPGVGPCAHVDDGPLANPAACFETSRWTASLGAQYALRTDLDLAGGTAGTRVVQDAFWDVGQAARRGLVKNQAPVDNAEQNWVNWMYLGWVLAPGNHASGYTASGLSQAGLPRHAAFVALRSMVARPVGSRTAYDDLVTTARHAPDGWLLSAYATGVSVLEARQGRGWAPEGHEARTEAKEALERAGALLARRLGARTAAALVARTRALRDGL